MAMATYDDELLAMFHAEAGEHLADIETHLLALEQSGGEVDVARVNDVFRAAHSIKGSAGFLAFTTIQELAHKIENVLDAVRTLTLAPTSEVINTLLGAFDRLRALVAQAMDSNGQDISAHVTALVTILAPPAPAPPPAPASDITQIAHPSGHPVLAVPRATYEKALKRKNIFLVDVDLIGDLHVNGILPADFFQELGRCGQVLACAVDGDAVGPLAQKTIARLPVCVLYATVMDRSMLHTFALPESQIHQLHDREQPDRVPPAPVAAPPAPAPVAASPAPAPAASPALPDPTLRVSLTLLESLMNLAGELVLSRNQLRMAIAQEQMHALREANQRIDQVTSELQDTIMQTRLQPIGTVLGKFPRLVRDLADSSGKNLHLEIVGKDVALDRSLIEGLSDPLTHMVRNAVDHGIELPEVREAAGKPRQGEIRIEARHEAGQVLVEIGDDGGGLDPERIAASAIQKGLIAPDRVLGMTAQEKMSLVFLPGLSTKREVSDLSGRGVGMDVVKTNLDRLGGKVEIRSEVGHGTIFTIKLPLTLTVIPSLIFTMGTERFAIPQINVRELLHVRPGQAHTRLERVGDHEVLVLRDALIPVVRFADVLGMPSPHDAPEGQQVVVVTAGPILYALVVDAFEDTEEIVVKTLGHHLQCLAEYAGATVMGDGTIALILDVAGLAQQARVTGDAYTTELPTGFTTPDREGLIDPLALLLFQNGPRERCAMPLDAVLRIEHITAGQIEWLGGRRTMQYRGHALPLVALADQATVDAIDGHAEYAVIVVSVDAHTVGILGTFPVDVADIHGELDAHTHRQRGIAGSMIIAGQTVLLIDLPELFAAAPAPAPAPVVPTAPAATRILLAEDSDFFRAQVQRYLEDDGHQVAALPDGEAAWAWLCAHPDAVDLVVTDIEMPRLDGLSLTRRIRAEATLAHLPVVTLTSLSGEDDIARGLAAGVTRYLIKLNRDQLLDTVRTLLHARPALA
jgi:two-component system chemotaxis sensor kinase CheA